MNQPDIAETPALIGLDWGTSQLRGYALAADGRCLQRRDGGPGIMSVRDGGFPDALVEFAGDWLREHPTVPVIASGMVGSRQGWREVPYLACPAALDDLASAVVVGDEVSGRGIRFVPGLSFTDETGTPDVMRGEETQILGCVGRDDAHELVLLPGTHSKWVWVDDGFIQRFSTFMTGEVFALLAKHSILARSMRGEEHDADAFLDGVGCGLNPSPQQGGLLKRLFGVRSLGLFGKLDDAAAHAYLSGVMIGTEVREACDMRGAGKRGALDAARVLIVGGEALASRYELALEQAGMRSQRAAADSAARGHYLVGRSLQLV